MRIDNRKIWLAAAAAAVTMGLTPVTGEAGTFSAIRACVEQAEEKARTLEEAAAWIAAHVTGEVEDQTGTEAAETTAAETAAAEQTEAETTAAEQTEEETAAEETTAAETTAVETTAAAEPVTMYTTWSLAMRSQATKESEKLGSVPINAEVKVFDTTQEYFEIEYEGTHGFVLGKYLTEDQAEAKAAEEESIAEAEAEKKSSGSSSKKSSSKKSSKSSKKSSKKKSKSSGDSKKKKDKECLTGGLLN